MSRSSPYPDDLAERDYYDETIGVQQDDERINDIRYIGVDKAIVERRVENVHWSKLPKSTYVFPPREFGDNNAQSPEEAEWENHDE